MNERGRIWSQGLGKQTEATVFSRKIEDNEVQLSTVMFDCRYTCHLFYGSIARSDSSINSLDGINNTVRILGHCTHSILRNKDNNNSVDDFDLWSLVGVSGPVPLHLHERLTACNKIVI